MPDNREETTELKDVDVQYISLVRRGANRQRFEIFKSQDYEPEGASVTMLIAEHELTSPDEAEDYTHEEPGPLPKNIANHLDKSHVTVHTYPEIHPHDGISTFRADIDVSTCGLISPLRALNYLIHVLDADIDVGAQPFFGNGAFRHF